VTSSNLIYVLSKNVYAVYEHSQIKGNITAIGSKIYDVSCISSGCVTIWYESLNNNNSYNIFFKYLIIRINGNIDKSVLVEVWISNNREWDRYW